MNLLTPTCILALLKHVRVIVTYTVIKHFFHFLENSLTPSGKIDPHSRIPPEPGPTDFFLKLLTPQGVLTTAENGPTISQ